MVQRNACKVGGRAAVVGGAIRLARAADAGAAFGWIWAPAQSPLPCLSRLAEDSVTPCGDRGVRHCRLQTCVEPGYAGANLEGFLSSYSGWRLVSQT